MRYLTESVDSSDVVLTSEIVTCNGGVKEEKARMADNIEPKIEISTLGAKVRKAPKAAIWVRVPADLPLVYEHRGDVYVISPPSGSPGFPVELSSNDIRVENGSLEIRRGAHPLSRPTITTAMRTVAGCIYDPDECDSDGESGCTFCTGVLLFCCGGGHTGFCAGVWGCP